jgi:hypothetical protein
MSEAILLKASTGMVTIRHLKYSKMEACTFTQKPSSEGIDWEGHHLAPSNTVRWKPAPSPKSHRCDKIGRGVPGCLPIPASPTAGCEEYMQA